ncbi:MAG: flagellar biosynthetic protein FliQ [Polyangiales bacterium]
MAEWIHIASQGVWLVWLLSLPMLAAALLVGVCVATLQSATQLHEPSVTYLCKAVAVTLALVAAAGWMGAVWLEFTQRLWSALATLALES